MVAVGTTTALKCSSLTCHPSSIRPRLQKSPNPWELVGRPDLCTDNFKVPPPSPEWDDLASLGHFWISPPASVIELRTFVSRADCQQIWNGFQSAKRFPADFKPLAESQFWVFLPWQLPVPHYQLVWCYSPTPPHRPLLRSCWCWSGRAMAWWPPNQLPRHQQQHQGSARYTSRISLRNSSCSPKCWRTEIEFFLQLTHDLQWESKTSSPPGFVSTFWSPKLSIQTHASYFSHLRSIVHEHAENLREKLLLNPFCSSMANNHQCSILFHTVPYRFIFLHIFDRVMFHLITFIFPHLFPPLFPGFFFTFFLYGRFHEWGYPNIWTV